MHILVLYNQPQSDRPDDKDTLEQALQIRDSLIKLGHTAALQAIEEDPNCIARLVHKSKANMVFNCVEEYLGSSNQCYRVVEQLEQLTIPFTGCNSLAMRLTNSKIFSKKILAKAAIATADSITLDTDIIENSTEKYLIKSDSEHASIGIDQHSIVTGERRAQRLIKKRQTQYGGVWFAEKYIDGREFNVAIIGSHAAPVALPINEIVFSDAYKHQAKIVDYDAKWTPSSLSYQHTNRITLDTHTDVDIQSKLREMALMCWQIFHLNGYARIDFRVDNNDQPWVLEINANPCLSQDAGFAASASAHGLTYESMIETILNSNEVQDEIQ